MVWACSGIDGLVPVDLQQEIRVDPVGICPEREEGDQGWTCGSGLAQLVARLDPTLPREHHYRTLPKEQAALLCCYATRRLWLKDVGFKHP